IETLDITTQLAIAAGIEALRDAGIPLIKENDLPSSTGHLGEQWLLPENMRKETGVIFASAFPGLDFFIKEMQNGKEKEFNRKFLLGLLSMGHSQFAQYIGAKGPNTQVNSACSSTSVALAIAEDWIRLGRCKRVLVIAADDVTNSNMTEWIGSGFLASGAATTADRVEKAALPFDKRRNGLLLGMGAIGIVLESQDAAAERGVVPIAEILGTHVANSAFHGLQLNPKHIASEMQDFIQRMEETWQFNRFDIVADLTFFSHETHTPPRGGSASAEVIALRTTFGEVADQILITNTKGFTGHSMGAGIEDVVAAKILEKKIIPPIANFKEVDPSLGDLRYSLGGKYENIRYVLRFAAGFGSQVAFTLFRSPNNNHVGRFIESKYHHWISTLGGSHNHLEVVKRTLKLRIPKIQTTTETASASTSLGKSTPFEEKIHSEVISIVAEKTGYPTSVLGLDMDLEADLGIDTVKQAELIGLIREKWNLSREKGVKISEFPTLGHVVNYIVSRLKQADTQSGVNQSHITAITQQQTSRDPEKAELSLDDSPISDEILRRFKVKFVEQQAGSVSYEMEGKTFLLLTKENPFSDHLVKLLEKKRMNILQYDLAEIGKPDILRIELQSCPPVDGILYLVPHDNIEEVWTRERMDAKNLFAICQTVSFNEHPMLFVASQSPAFGWIDTDSPWIGSVTGFMKALAREWNGNFRVIACQHPEEVIHEFSNEDKVTEVVYRNGKRGAFALHQDNLEIPQPDIKSKIGPNDLLVVTGGAQGITYLSTKKIVELWKPRIAILGRTQRSDDPQLLEDLDEDRLEIRRIQLIDELKTKFERVTPVMIEEAWNNHLKMIQIEKALEELQSLGSEVHYYSVDITDQVAMNRTVQQIQEDYAAEITGIIHGAGIEKSKSIDRKTQTEFDRIHDTKVLGFCNLIQGVNIQNLKICVLFSSIAGRFGNPGQVDYSAANDFLAKTAWFLQKQNIPAVAIDWSAWKEIGMATRGSSTPVLLERGITPIPKDLAVESLIEEILYGKSPEVVIAGALGILEPHPEQNYQHPGLSFPMTDVLHEEGTIGEIISERTLNLDHDLYLADHQIHGSPVLPGVMGLEMFWETFVHSFPEQTVERLERVRFQSPVKVPPGTTKHIRCRLNQENPPKMLLESDRPVIQGVRSNKPIIHFEAQLGPSKDLQKGPKMPLNLTNLPVVLDREEIYSLLFHGPRFQVLGNIRCLSPELLAEVQMPSVSLFSEKTGSLFSMPLVLEAAFQTAGIYCLLHYTSEVLPVSVEQILFYQQTAPAKAVRVVPTGNEDQVFRFDISVINHNDELLCELKGCKLARIGKLKEKPSLLIQDQANTVQQIFQRMNVPVRAVNITNLSTLVGEVVSGFTEKWLCPEEHDHLRQHKITKRRNEWLAGLLAAKIFVMDHSDCFCSPMDIKLIYSPSGSPMINVFTNGTTPQSFPVTISHRMNVAVAYVDFKGNRPGIDLEWLENKPSAFLDEAFTKEEQLLLSEQSDPEAASISLWAAKEAVLKSVELGLNCDLHELQTEEFKPPNQVQLSMTGNLRKRMKQQNQSTRYEVVLGQKERFIGAFCTNKPH
ncbi:MAG: SDR family NAD(P)-dependent oxidoreductase, partial [Candidatus Hodarchaeales archaeon]